jgi:GTPase
LETDRRLLQKRVEMLQSRLEKVEVQRTQMRRARLRNAIPRVALVGYTNAGKSTLFNTLSGSGVYVADKLFATLDPTVRRLDIAGGSSLVLSDTVGFVRDLPHDLIAAFRSTLSEARDADLLLHVVDAADPLRDERIEQVDAVLAEIGAGDIPQLLIFNKIDRLEDVSARHDVPGHGHERFWLSAKTGEGVELFKQALGTRFSQQRYQTMLQLPPDQGRLYSRLYAAGAIAAESCDEHGWALEIDMPLAQAERMAVEPGGHFLQEALLVGLVDPNYNP